MATDQSFKARDQRDPWQTQDVNFRDVMQSDSFLILKCVHVKEK